MCEGHHEGHHRRGHRRGRHGFPNREQLVERLTGYRQHLESELQNVQDLLERLGDSTTPGESGPQPEGV
jgi:hypothetical protein